MEMVKGRHPNFFNSSKFYLRVEVLCIVKDSLAMDVQVNSCQLTINNTVLPLKLKLVHVTNIFTLSLKSVVAKQDTIRLKSESIIGIYILTVHMNMNLMTVCNSFRALQCRLAWEDLLTSISLS